MNAKHFGRPIAMLAMFILASASGSLNHFSQSGSVRLQADLGRPAQASRYISIKNDVAASQTKDSGFVPLFNGRDLSGWKIPAGDNGHWRVSEGTIDYDASSEAAGDKSLWTERAFRDFVLRVDWRIKSTPYINPAVPIIRYDGTEKKDAAGREIRIAVPDSDSGIYLRGSSKAQVNIWCWPIGSGEVYGYRTDGSMPRAVRAAVTPKRNADRDIGEWNTFEITLRGARLTVVLNGEEVLSSAELPGIPASGPLALQHHGEKKGGAWVAPPSLVQFRNISIKEL